MGLELPFKKIDWLTYRIIPSREPPINVFDRVARADEFDALYEIEALTNDRLRAEQGSLQLLPRSEWVFGNSASYIMAPFLHLNPEGSRFSDGSYGVYYCAKSLETALQETRFHRANFLRRTRERPIHLEMRWIEARLKGKFHDIRKSSEEFRDVYDLSSYAAGQRLGRELRAKGSQGILFKSVRDLTPKRNDCAAVFRPKNLSLPRIGGHFIYVWDGEEIVAVYEKK